MLGVFPFLLLRPAFLDFGGRTGGSWYTIRHVTASCPEAFKLAHSVSPVLSYRSWCFPMRALKSVTAALYHVLSSSHSTSTISFTFGSFCDFLDGPGVTALFEARATDFSSSLLFATAAALRPARPADADADADAGAGASAGTGAGDGADAGAGAGASAGAGAGADGDGDGDDDGDGDGDGGADAACVALSVAAPTSTACLRFFDELGTFFSTLPRLASPPAVAVATSRSDRERLRPRSAAAPLSDSESDICASG